VSEAGEVTRLLTAVRDGDEHALEQLIPLVYQELRRLAAYFMQKEQPDHTWRATELVHEAYLRLVGRELPEWQNRAHFFAAAAQVMRNLLVDHARARRRAKRGGGAIRLDQAPEPANDRSEELLAIDDALERLAKIDPRQGRIVELRYFGGLSIEEIAAVMEISERTVSREWQMARVWLRTEVKGSK
jgi:RNA polymerase sigma factor (TIGR02999 family)